MAFPPRPNHLYWRRRNTWPMGPTLDDDSRGVSEGTGLAVLIALTVLVTASVGVSVVFLDTSDGAVGANFSFEHLRDSGTLLITHAGGDDIPAGDLLIAGPGNNLTWATAAGFNESTAVTQGNLVQISAGNDYGQRVDAGDDVRVLHAPAEGNRTVLGRWESG
jgi:hypothetical protein